MGCVRRIEPMSRFANHLRARPRLTMSCLVGVAAGYLAPDIHSSITRALLGWNVAVWLYVALIGVMMVRADHGRLKRVAIAQGEGAAVMLALVSAAAVASLAGIVVELSAAKVPGARHALPHVAFALVTVIGSWLLLPMVFALTYASTYYRAPPGSQGTLQAGGLQFPGADEAFKPHYDDFLYFSFTIAVAAQTSDVCVSTPAMRRLVLMQSVLAFAFNTAILAFTINIAASMF